MKKHVRSRIDRGTGRSRRRFDAVPGGRRTVSDGVVSGPLPEVVADDANRQRERQDDRQGAHGSELDTADDVHGHYQKGDDGAAGERGAETGALGPQVAAPPRY